MVIVSVSPMWLNCRNELGKWIQIHIVATQDRPDGHDDVLVCRCKDRSVICSACFYSARGSFPGVKAHDLKTKMDEHPTISEKPPGFCDL